MLMGLTDTLVVGRHSSLELAGVAAGNSVFWVVCIVTLGLQFGMDSIVAQAHGAGNSKRAQTCLWTSLRQSWIAAFLALILLQLISYHFEWTGAVPQVAERAGAFLSWLAFSLPILVTSVALQRYWLAQGVILPFALIVLGANGLNYLLNLAFVPGNFGFPALGAQGAALATLSCRIFMLLADLSLSLYLWKKRDQLSSWQEMWNCLWKDRDPQLSKQLLSLGWPAMGQMALEVGAFSLVTILAARVSTLAVATHQIVLNIASFAFMFPSGLASATASRVGYLIGAHEAHAAKLSGWLGILAGIGIMSLSAVILFTWPQQLIGLFTQDAAVIHTGASIIFLCVCFQIFDGIQVVAAGALRGLGNTKLALGANLISHWFLGLPLGVFLCFESQMGIWGLWVGLALGLCSTAVLNSLAWHLKSRHLKRLESL